MRIAACFVLLLSAATGRAEPPKDDDAKKLQGTWEIVSSEDGGDKVASEVGGKVVISADKITLAVGEKRASIRYKLDPTKTPKWIDLVNEQDEMAPGIYELDGDTLKICFPESGKERATKFESKKNSPNDRFMVLKRAK